MGSKLDKICQDYAAQFHNKETDPLGFRVMCKNLRNGALNIIDEVFDMARAGVICTEEDNECHLVPGLKFKYKDAASIVEELTKEKDNGR